MSKSEDRSGLDRASMERMSTSDLEELLRQDFQAPEGGEADPGGLYQAAQVLAEREHSFDAAVDRAWESFRENYLPFAKDSSSLYEDGPQPSSDAVQGRRQPPLQRWIHGLLVAAVLAAILLSVSVAGTSAGGYDLWGARLAWWTDEEMGITPGRIECASRDDIRIPEEPRDYAGIGEALEDCGLTLPLAPRWVPEGFEMDFMDIDELVPDTLIFYAHYARGDENLVVEVSVYIEREDGGGDRDYGSFQKDRGDPTPYEAGGVTHLLTTNAGRPTALWTRGPAECVVSGDITMEELKQIIDSIYR